jgi:hypothetical protein
MTDEEKSPKRATAKATVFIEVKLANSNEKFIFDVETAKELETELGLALATLNPPRIVPAHQVKK